MSTGQCKKEFLFEEQRINIRNFPIKYNFFLIPPYPCDIVMLFSDILRTVTIIIGDLFYFSLREDAILTLIPVSNK